MEYMTFKCQMDGRVVYVTCVVFSSSFAFYGRLSAADILVSLLVNDLLAYR